MPTVTHTALGYRATRDGDTLTVHQVPIFVDCEREHQDGTAVFDAKWVAGAVATAMQQQRDGYLPPLHIRHHGEESNPAGRAGVFRIVGAKPITLKGERRTAILADLIITDEFAQEEVIKGALPYRSVEIHDIEDPKITSLALLDTEAPFLELPMLLVSDVEGGKDDEPQTSVIDTVIPGAKSGLVRVASFRRGSEARLLFKEDSNMTSVEEAAAVEADAKKQAELFADDDKDKKKNGDKKGEDMESASLDVSAIVKAIESGEIAVKDFDAILAAIQAQGQAAAPEETPAPAAVPGAESMTAKPTGDSVKMAALEGKLFALEAKDRARDEAESATADVEAAYERLKDRPMGADLRARLTGYRSKHKGEAFQALVEIVANSVGVLPGDTDPASFTGALGKAPEEALKYQKDGMDAVDRAAKFCAEWEQLAAVGGLRTTKERYVELNMAKTA